MMVTKQLLSLDEITNTEEHRQVLMRVLCAEEKAAELVKLFPNPGFQWKSYITYISELYTKTVRCLDKMTRNMTYVDNLENDAEQIGLLKRLQDDMDEVIWLFGSKNEVWVRRFSNPKLPNEAKVVMLRRFLAAGLANTFGWLSTPKLSKYGTKLFDLQTNLLKMEDLSQENDIIWLPNDKIAYMNVAFAHRYHHMVNCNLDQHIWTRSGGLEGLGHTSA